MGYAGGSTENPSYRNIGDYSETVQVDFYPEKISYTELLNIFWRGHDPTSPAFSRQYRSVIFYKNEKQKKLAIESKAREEKRRGKKIYTAVEPLRKFYLAEGYHQKYYLRQDRVLMKEMKQLYPKEEDFVNSTIAARLNSYLAGFGNAEQIKRQIDSSELSEQAREYLLKKVAGH